MIAKKATLAAASACLTMLQSGASRADVSLLTVQSDFPCAKCVVAAPAGARDLPLLVLLHGDGQPATKLFDAWKNAALAHGFAVGALSCPAELGCQGSWWRWNGDPEWISTQVDRIAERISIDRKRRAIVGFSGGASYIGYRTQELEKKFSAIVIHGGGMGPRDGRCSAEKRRVHFLVGDKNPLHGLAVGLRDHYERCKHPVTWTLLPGADHPAEWKAFPEKREALLGWLADR